MYLSIAPDHFGDCRPGFVIPANVERCSIYDASEAEIMKFKWIESQRAGRDLGEDAVRQWVVLHWSGFLRARWIEHLQGVRFWCELDSHDFNLVNREPPEVAVKLNQIVEQLKHGAEILNILVWAHDTGETRGLIVQLLDKLQVNSKRLWHKYDPYFR